MPAHMKKHHISVSIDGTPFIIPKQKKAPVVSIIKALGGKELKLASKIPADSVYKKIFGDIPKAAVILRGARQKEGLSQKELAKATGIDQGNISKMEKGERPIGSSIAMKLGAALNIDYRVFLK